MGLWKEVFKMGPQAILDQAMGKAIGGVFKGVGGFVTGTARGATFQASNAHNWSGLGKATSAMGYGLGKGASATVIGTGATVAGVGGIIGKGIYKTFPRDWEWLKHTSYGLWNAATREVPQELLDVGITGIGGRVAKPGVAWGIAGAAALYGAGKSASNYDYNLGLKTLTNGIMDTQGVSLTPGSIGASYTPVYGRKGLRDLGVTGDLGFALHNQRHTGQI